MKQMNVKNWMAALLLTGVCCGFVACNDDDGENTPPPAEPNVTAVIGEYAGTMQIIEPTPTAESGEEPTGTPLTASVTGDQILFENFPIRDLIVKIIKDEALADQIVAKIGQVDYAVPYAALMSEDKTTVRMTLTPDALKITLGGSEEPAPEPQAEEAIEIEVTISTAAEGVYTIESEKLSFTLSAEAVKYGGTELPGFEAFTLGFNLTKAQ